MKWVGIVVRTLVGAGFFFLGITYFLPVMDMTAQMEAMPDSVKQYFGLMGGYLTVVKVLEIIGGAMLLTGMFVGLGITILTPICVNILLYDIYIMKQPFGGGIILTALCVVLIAAYWPHFRAAFVMRAMPCQCRG